MLPTLTSCPKAGIMGNLIVPHLATTAGMQRAIEVLETTRTRQTIGFSDRCLSPRIVHSQSRCTEPLGVSPNAVHLPSPHHALPMLWSLLVQVVHCVSPSMGTLISQRGPTVTTLCDCWPPRTISPLARASDPRTRESIIPLVAY